MNPPYQDPPLPDQPADEDLAGFSEPTLDIPAAAAQSANIPARESAGMSFDFDGLYNKVRRDGFASLDPAQQELLRNMKKGIDYSPASAAAFVQDYSAKLREQSSPAAQLDLAKKQAEITASQKGKPLTSTEVNDLTQLKSVEFSLDELEKKLTALPKDKRGPVAGRLAGTNPYDADVQEIQNIITSIVPGLARGVFQEVGVLTEPDVKRYTNLLPNHTVPPEVAERNLTNLRAKLRDSKIKKIETMQKAGMDVSGFMDDYNQLVNQTAAQASDPFQPGKRYKDAAGNVRTYKGNGAWE